MIMEIYRQTDVRWKEKRLGESPYFMGTPGVGFGCTTTVVAQLLTLAGYSITPGDVNDRLMAIHGYTDRKYMPEFSDGGSGLILWYKVMEAFPMFHWNNGGPYQIMVGDLGVYNHWSAQYQGVSYDSITGSTALYPRVHNWRVAYGCSIDPPPVVPVAVPAPTVNVPVSFQIIVDGPIGSAHFRKEPSLASEIMNTYDNGTTVDCIDTVEGETVSVTWSDGRTVSSSKWYKSLLHGEYISAAVSKHN